MAIYRHRFCGSMYDGEKEGAPVRELRVCPVCGVASDKLVSTGGVPGASGNESRLSGSVSTPAAPVSTTPASAAFAPASPEKREALPYDPKYVRLDTDSRYMDEIHKMAVKDRFIITTMDTQTSIPGWDGILFLDAQLDPMPLDGHVPAEMKAIIDKETRKPVVLEHLVYISHMSFGALSKETKTTLAVGNAMARTAMCSSEGGILPQKRKAVYKYIFEYVPNLYSVSEESLWHADAAEIKIGQGTEPGMDGHLLGSEMTPEIAAMHDKSLDRDVINPSRLPGINSKEDLKTLVDRLGEGSEDRPIGVKIATGRIEENLEFYVYAGPDFITVDGRSGTTGTSSKLIKDSASVPIIYALYRAKGYLDGVRAGVELVITGGLEVSSDFAKVLAMGADTVAIASATLITATRQWYHICRTGMCLVGVATQDEVLCRRLPMDATAQRVVNFLDVSLEGIETFAGIMGHHNIHDMGVGDLCTISREVSEFTNIRRA